MKILGIETSCDETGLAVVEQHGGLLRVRSSVITSQIATHRKFGGVVPEVAAREHVPAIIPMLRLALDEARVPLKAIDRIAVTAGPGLFSALMVGVETARALSYATRIPVIGVNHIEGHLAANWLDRPSASIRFPVLGLVVSGGHTELIQARKPGTWKLISRTRDDAAGEAFDKVAHIFGLRYPGGPEISKLAERGDQFRFAFPRPMIASGLDFSFAGLKTSVLYFLKRKGWVGHPPKKDLPDLCASFQAAVVDVLAAKTVRAAKKINPKTVLLAGGVAANLSLRRTLRVRLAKSLPFVRYLEPALSYCTDNAAMIAAAASFHKKPTATNWRQLQADPNWELVY